MVAIHLAIRSLSRARPHGDRLDYRPDPTCGDAPKEYQPDGACLTSNPPADWGMSMRAHSRKRSGPAWVRSDGPTIGSRKLECSTMERIVIRPARANDAADLARNWIETAQHYVELDPEAFRIPSTDGLVESFEESLKRPRSEDSAWLVAEVDGQVVGDVSARLERPARDAERQVLRYLGEVRVYVDALSVVHAYRRLGVGTRLMHAIERWARERGAVCAMLDTYAASRCRCRSTNAVWATGGARLSSRSGSTRGPMSVPVSVHQPAPDRTLAVCLDSTPDLSCTNSTQAYCMDVDHQPTDLAVGGSNPSRRA
jgi:GNAT superfamily N-acetyltransferase